MTKFWTQDLRRQLRDGRRHGHRHGVPVRHQLGRAIPASSATCSARPWPPRASSPSSSNRASWPCWCSAGTAFRRGCTSSPRSWWRIGTIFSAVWIIIANSWQHTPAGYHIVMHEGRPRAEITDFWAMVFNPSRMHRLGHVILRGLHPGGVLRDERVGVVPPAAEARAVRPQGLRHGPAGLRRSRRC